MKIKQQVQRPWTRWMPDGVRGTQVIWGVWENFRDSSYKMSDLGRQWRSVLGNMTRLCLSSTILVTVLSRLYQPAVKIGASWLCWLPRAGVYWKLYNLPLEGAIVGWNRRCAAFHWAEHGELELKVCSLPWWRLWRARLEGKQSSMEALESWRCLILTQHQPVLLSPVPSTAGLPSFVPLSRVLSFFFSLCSHHFCVKSYNSNYHVRANGDFKPFFLILY